MRKTLFLLSIGFTMLGCVSCNNQDSGYNDTLSCPTDSLSSEILNDTFLFAKPTGLFLYDSLLIVADSRCGDNLFYVFKASDGTFLRGGGKRGNAPGEVLSPEKVHIDCDSMLSYWDIHKQKLIRYDMEAFLNDSARYFLEQSLRNEQMQVANILDAIAIKDDYLYNQNTEQHIGIYRANNFLDAPSLPGIPSVDICRAIMNGGHLEASPDGKHAVRATSIGGIIQCYDIENRLIKARWLKLFFPPIYKIAEGANPIWITWEPETQMGFEDLYVTNQAIYLLLNGKFAKDEPYANEILVLDWDGNLIKKYLLDKTVRSIAVNEAQNMLYAVTCGFDVEPHIVCFAL